MSAKAPSTGDDTAPSEAFLADCVTKIIAFLEQNPTLLPTAKSNIPNTSLEYRARYAQSRRPNRPKPPATSSDPLVSFILNVYFGIEKTHLERAKEEHKWAMAAEDMVGDLLERYLAAKLEPQGWVWCAGSSVKSVDFIKPPNQENENWVALQIKNRDNSENSSSKAVRDGTQIIHWFRSFSKKPETNWPAFPDEEARKILSETDFQAFVKEYLEALKINQT